MSDFQLRLILLASLENSLADLKQEILGFGGEDKFDSQTKRLQVESYLQTTLIPNMLSKVKGNVEKHAIVIKESDKRSFSEGPFDALVRHYLKNMGLTAPETKLGLVPKVDEVKKKETKTENAPNQ